MGVVQHNALFITSQDKYTKRIRRRARLIFKEYNLQDCVGKIGGVGMNGYMSFVIFPSGSNAHWEMDEQHESSIKKLIEYIDEKEIGSYVWLTYGEAGTEITDHNCPNRM